MRWAATTPYHVSSLSFAALPHAPPHRSPRRAPHHRAPCHTSHSTRRRNPCGGVSLRTIAFCCLPAGVPTPRCGQPFFSPGGAAPDRYRTHERRAGEAFFPWRVHIAGELRRHELRAHSTLFLYHPANKSSLLLPCAAAPTPSHAAAGCERCDHVWWGAACCVPGFCARAPTSRANATFTPCLVFAAPAVLDLRCSVLLRRVIGAVISCAHHTHHRNRHAHHNRHHATGTSTRTHAQPHRAPPPHGPQQRVPNAPPHHERHTHAPPHAQHLLKQGSVLKGN